MKVPFFTVVLAIYPVLSIAASNPGQVAAGTIGTTLLTAGLAASMLLALVRPFFPSWSHGAVGVAVLIFLFYSYGPVHTALELILLDALTGTSRASRLMAAVAPHLHLIMSSVWTLFGCLGLWASRRVRPQHAQGAVHGLNLISLFLMALVALQWGIEKGRDIGAAGRHTSGDALGGLEVSVAGYNPDVYVIVLDGYAREDVLAQHYGFDNSEFLNSLASRGFQTGAASTANYHWTFLSLASTLNMDYVQPLMGEAISPRTESRAAVYDAIRNNAVMRFLRDRGYRTFHLQSTWGATLHNRYADVDVPCHGSVFKDEFMRVFAEASWLKIFHARASADLAECYLSNFDNLAAISSQPGPKFVFAHFLPPHHPYVFDRSGAVVDHVTVSNQFDFQRRLWEKREQYLDQLVFVNRRITEAVDTILRASRRAPVIVLMSDHGPNIERGMDAEEVLRVRFANLSALLLPEAPPGLIPPSASLVNLYRRILNHYFRTELAILPDRYYSSPFAPPYEFREVAFD